MDQQKRDIIGVMKTSPLFPSAAVLVTLQNPWKEQGWSGQVKVDKTKKTPEVRTMRKLLPYICKASSDIISKIQI